MKHTRFKGTRTGREGIALLTATIFLAMAVLILGALTTRVINQNHQVTQYVAFKDCFQGLEAAFNQARVSVEMGGTGMIGTQGWTPPTSFEGPPPTPTFADSGVTPLQIASMPRVEYMAYAQDWSTDGWDNNGDGSIDDESENFVYTIHSAARLGAIERRAEVVMKGSDVNVWRNAIFGGAGQAGGLINGNVSIYGSVHLLGDFVAPGNEAVTAIDLSGTSLIHNNYADMPAALRQRIPTPPKRMFEGEEVETLNAVLRVRRGLVGMSGNSEIGQPDVKGNVHKETMDGTFVNDGWTGNAVINDGDRGIPNSVHSDNGWDMAYDLGNRVPLPLFQHDWRDMYTGQTVFNPNTGANYTHLEYFGELSGTPYNGDITIKANQNFYYNATRPNDPNPANRLPTDDFILYNGTTKRMEMNGQIQINGNLELTRGGGNDRTINYTGRAAILVRGDVRLDTDLLSMNADGTTANSFPQNNVFGIMAENNMLVGTLSQLTLMGAFYAQNQIKSEKQTIVLGTFVSNYFDMGSQVPDIYQVPSLADHLPYGIIGAYPILAMSQVSWRELGV